MCKFYFYFSWLITGKESRLFFLLSYALVDFFRFFFPFSLLLVDNGKNGNEWPRPSDSPAAKIVDTNVEQTIKEDTSIRTCATCEKVFKTAYAYTRHLCQCKSMVMECSICETKFPNGQQMRKHINETHEGKLWACTYESCYRYFGTKKGMTYHLGEHVQRNFSCASCNEDFVSADELNVHKRSQDHRQRSKQSICKSCKNTFSGKYERDRHFNTTCPFNAERTVKCKVCNYNTGKAKDFLSHLQEKHNSQLQYICTRCLLDFPTSKELDKHQLSCKVK